MKAPFLCALLLSAPVLHAADHASLSEAFAAGKFSLNARLRGEQVAQTALRDAQALTLRTRLGFTTAPLAGWKAMLEVEHIVAADGDSYSQAGLNSGGAGRAVVADPESTDLNQAWLAYSTGPTIVTAGRQRLVLDNARFIGDVGWRQNMQTFDAVVMQNRSLDHVVVTYAYLDRINRVFSTRHTQGRWDSRSHVINVSFSRLPAVTVTTYAYLLDFANAATNSCATFGFSLAGSAKFSNELKLTYRAELANQEDYGVNPLNYRAGYLDLEAGIAGGIGSVTVGHERLGAGHNVGFKTPLATLHAFNGWADLFLGTPAHGLTDTFLKATSTLPGDLALLGVFHSYHEETTGGDLGSELDLQLSRKFGTSITGLVKCANFRPGDSALPNVRKVWIQVEYTY